MSSPVKTVTSGPISFAPRVAGDDFSPRRTVSHNRKRPATRNFFQHATLSKGHRRMKNSAVQFCVLLMTATAPLPLSAQETADTTNNGYGMWEWSWGHTLSGHLPMVAIWLAAFAVLVLALQRLGRRNREKPLDILRPTLRTWRDHKRRVRGSADGCCPTDAASERRRPRHAINSDFGKAT